MRTEMGREIRKAFVAQKSDSVMISADYSQIEIRLMCHFAKPSSLSKALHQGYDIHLQTAAEIFSLPPEKVSKTKRAYAKAINFGIIYGMGPRRLSQEIQVPLKAAKEFIEKYFETYPQIKLYSESLIKEARNKGYCTTITGRRRALPGLQDDNSMLASRAENMAVNTPLQGSAADLIKIAMIKISNEFEKKKINAKMLLQIHDELLFECHKDHVTEAEKIITHEMENAMKLSVPLKVEINHGKNWLAAHG
jgi:DNA polymerase-1